MEYYMTKVVVFVALIAGAQSDLTQSQKDNLVSWHNDKRDTITDSGSTIETISWKDSLGTIAQNWADECQQAHNSDRKTQANGYTDILKKNIGENIAWGSSNLQTLVVDGWWAEYQYYHISDNSCDTGKVCGHYKQMARDKTYAIGCGYTTCDFGGFLVCNYEPGVYGSNAPYTYQA